MRSLPFLLALALVAPTAAQPGPLPALPPLSLVIDRVAAHSPALAYAAATVEKNEAQLGRVRSAWTDNIGANIGATAGTFGSALADEVAIGTTVGFGVRVSLYDVLGRRHERRQAAAELAQAEARQAEAEEELALVVTALYRKTELAYRLVDVRSGGMESARAHRLMAEAEFGQGEVPVGELARVDQIAAEARAAYETARADYLSAHAQLDVLCGGCLGEGAVLAAEGDGASASGDAR
jgi:outer membrane protein TolC